VLFTPVAPKGTLKISSQTGFGQEKTGHKILHLNLESSIAAIAWAKEWQPIIGGSLTVLAACIFTIGCFVARPGRRDHSGQIQLDGARQDLRTIPEDTGATPIARPVGDLDLLGNLQQLRSLVRSALAGLTAIEGAASAIERARQPCERITKLPLEKFLTARSTSKTAHELLRLLVQQIRSFGELFEAKAPVSDISAILIEVNATARKLTSLLQTPA
jgi:hypothetical protein